MAEVATEMVDIRAAGPMVVVVGETAGTRKYLENILKHRECRIYISIFH